MSAQVISLFGSHHGHDRRQPQTKVVLVSQGLASTGFTFCPVEEAVADLLAAGWAEAAPGVLVRDDAVAVVQAL